jgi:glycosyltransferase involved in cell wall biosynthesis
MRIWFVTIGEPVPLTSGFKDRLHRAGMMATAFSSAGHEVIWWTSGFDHFKKRHIVECNKEISVGPNFHIRIIKGPGYRSNVSLARLHDHNQVRMGFIKWARMEADRPQLIVTSLPTVGLCKASIAFGKEWGIPVIVDIRDLWPDIFADLAPKPLRSTFRLALTPLFRDCQHVCKKATALMGTTDGFLEWGLNLAGRERGEADTVLPFVYPVTKFSNDDLSGAERYWDALGVGSADKQKTVTFIGTLGRQFNLESVVRCAHRMTAKEPSLRFALCGAGDNLDYYRDMARCNPAIVMPGWIDAVKINVLLRRTAIGLNPLINRFDFLANINSKVAEYLASGVPILSTPENGALARLLRETGSGESTKEGDDRSLEAALDRVLGDSERLSHMKANAVRLYRDQFNHVVVYKKLITHVEAMIRDRLTPS